MFTLCFFFVPGTIFLCCFLSGNKESLMDANVNVGLKGKGALWKYKTSHQNNKCKSLWFITFHWFTVWLLPCLSQNESKEEKISCLSDGAQTTVKTDGGPDTQSDIGKLKNEFPQLTLCYSFSPCFGFLHQLRSHNWQLKSLCVLQHDLSVVLFLFVFRQQCN